MGVVTRLQSSFPGFGRLATVLLCGWLAAACATPPGADASVEQKLAFAEANDPLEPMNRYFFEVNRALDELLFKPISVIYRGVVPAPVRTGVRNVLNNLRTPWTFVNDLAQGEGERAGQSFGRLSGNTLIGVGGVFDVMAGEGPDAEGIPYHGEDFGQTLAVWGIEDGPYLVLPVFGPSNFRDALGKIVDTFLDPVQYLVADKNRLGFSLTRAGLSALDLRALNIETIDEIERSSIDYYATIRSLYRQRRRAEIANGRETDDEPSADIDAD